MPRQKEQRFFMGSKQLKNLFNISTSLGNGIIGLHMFFLMTFPLLDDMLRYMKRTGISIDVIMSLAMVK